MQNEEKLKYKKLFLLLALLALSQIVYAAGWPERAEKQNNTIYGPIKNFTERIQYSDFGTNINIKSFNINGKILSIKNVSENKVVKVILYEYLNDEKVLVSEYYKTEDNLQLLFKYERLYDNSNRIVFENIIETNSIPDFDHMIGLEDDELFIYPRNCTSKEYTYVDNKISTIKYRVKDTDEVILKKYDYGTADQQLKKIYGFGIGSLLNGGAAPDTVIYQEEIDENDWPIWTEYIYTKTGTDKHLEPKDFAIVEDDWLFSNVNNVVLVQDDLIREEIVFSPFYGHDLFARKYYYNERNLEVEQKNYSQKNCELISTFIIEYTKFDAYDNWIERIETRKDLLTNEVTLYKKVSRTIEYWD